MFNILNLVNSPAGRLAVLFLFAAISYVSVTSIAIEQQRKLGGRQDQKNWLVGNLVVALLVTLFYVWQVIVEVRK